jgi:hypothetical protein
VASSRSPNARRNVVTCRVPRLRPVVRRSAGSAL